jgi:putative transposase
MSFPLSLLDDGFHPSRSISRRAQLLGISRGSVYYVPTSISATDLAQMRRMDALHLEHPFYGGAYVARPAE